MRPGLRPLLPCLAFAAACGASAPPTPPQNVIEIEIDDHGLLGLWQANAPNLKSLIAKGVFGYSRVQVPAHSNQGNYATLTGQYPDGDDVPGNARLDRPGLLQRATLAGFEGDDYAFYDQNPLLLRGDSVYKAAKRLGIHPSYFGQIPPFDAGADDVHFTIGGAYPLRPHRHEGSPAIRCSRRSSTTPRRRWPRPSSTARATTGETLSHFTIRDAADFILKSSPRTPMPRFMYIWDFLALDSDPTAAFGSDVIPAHRARRARARSRRRSSR